MDKQPIKVNYYRPNRLRLLGLSIKSARWNFSHLKLLLVIFTIAVSALLFLHQLRPEYQQLIDSLDKVALAIGVSEPPMETSSVGESSSYRINKHVLHLFDIPAKIYLELNKDPAEPQNKPNSPWLLQGVADELSKDAENKKTIKKWIRLLK